MSDTHIVKKLYEQLISAWNIRDAEGMANQFTVDGEMIGFDGSQELGRETMLSHLAPIFASHPTAPYVTIIKNIAQLSDTVVLLRAIAGMILLEKQKLIQQSILIIPLSQSKRMMNGKSNFFKTHQHSFTEDLNLWRK